MAAESTSLTLKAANLVLKILKPVFKLAGKKIDENYFLYRRVHGLLSSSNSFDRIYSESIKKLDDSGVLREVVELLSTPSVRDSFKRSYSKGLLKDVLDAANAEVAIHDEWQILTGNVEPELERLLEIFTKQAQQKRTPSDAIAEERNAAGFKQILNELDKTFTASREYLDLVNLIANYAELREKGQHKAVLRLLEDYKSRNWTVLVPGDKRKVQVNLGVTYFEMADYEAASKCLTDIINYGDEGADSYAYAALGYALIGDVTNAKYYAEKAVLADPDNINGYSALLSAERDVLSIEMIEDLIPAKIRSLPVFALSIGARLEQNGMFEEAVSLYEGALTSFAKKDSNYYEVMYHLGVGRFRSLLLKDQAVFNQVTDEVREKVAEIVKLYEESWNFFKETDLRKSRWYILTNKAAALRILNDESGAEQAIRASIDLNPTFFSYKSLYISLINQEKETIEVIDEMLKLASTDDDFSETIVLKAELLLHNKNADEAIALLTANLDKCKASTAREGFYTVLVHALISAGKFEDARQVAADFLGDEPENFYANYLKIQVAEAKGDEVPQSEIDHLKSLIFPKSPIAYTVKLSDLYLRGELYQDAASVMEPVVETNIFSPLTQNLLHCYYKVGNHEKGIALGERLFANSSATPFVADYLSVIYETIADYDNAIRVIDGYLAQVPVDLHFKVKKAIIMCKANRISEGIGILDEISKDIDTLPIQEQYYIASAYLRGDRYEQGMEIAYNVRMKYASNPLAHENYLRIHFGLPDKGKEFYFPGVVEKDCFIVLEDLDGKRIEYIIVDKPKFDREIGLNEDISQKLISNAIGETVALNGNDYKIAVIIRKYTYAFHDSMNQIPIRFGDQVNGMKILKFDPDPTNPEDALKPILDSIDSSTEFEELVSTLYHKMQATIGSNAQLLGESPIDQWGRIRSDWKMGCYSVGSPDEYTRASELLASGTPIVVDVVALLTLFHIGGFDLLTQLKGAVYVTESTLAVIEDKIANYEISKNNLFVSLGKRDGEYFRHEFTLEEKEMYSGNLKLLLEHAKQYCQIGERVLSSAYVEKSQLDSLLGASFHDSAVLATKNGWILYSDDRNFRVVSANHTGVAGMSTFVMLHKFLTDSMITADIFSGYLTALVKLNYRDIPVNGTVLYELLKLSDYKIEQPFINGNDIFRQPDEVKAMILAVDFLFVLYTNNAPILRLPIAKFVIAKAFENKNTFNAKNTFVIYLHKKFHLLPLQCKEILQLL